MSYRYTRRLVRKISIFILFQLLLLMIELFFVRANAQNLTGNPWLSWVPELGNGTETPFTAFAYNSLNAKLTATTNDDCQSYGIGNDKRGYVYFADNSNSLIRCVDPGTKAVISSFGFTEGGAKFATPHSFKSFYIAATNKHYLVVSNVGESPVSGLPGTINTDGILTILDVTNPTAITFVTNILVPAATATGSRATGMDLIQTDFTSAGTALYSVVDDGVKDGLEGVIVKVVDPLSATPTVTAFSTRDGLGNTINTPHAIEVDALNNRLYISSIYSSSILSFTTSGTPTYNTYTVLDGDGTEPPAIHTLMLNKAGTMFYGGSMFDAGGNKAYMFTVQADKTAATATTINQTAKSAVLNYDGSTTGNVMGVNLLPDDTKLYAVLESNGSFNTARIYELDPITLATTAIIQNKAGTINATFGYLDPHSYAFTLNDFGDAPATYGSASHFLSNNDYSQDRLRIGATIDGDSSETNSADFNGDDLAATPKIIDEDGITTSIKLAAGGLYYGMTGTYTINGIAVKNTTSPAVTANLIGWIDFNHDGIFQSTEAVAVPVPNGTTSVNLSWAIPADVSTGPVLLRLRLSTDPSLTVNTPASMVFDGEVEDHKFPVPINVSGSVFGDKDGNTIFGSTGAAGSGENGTTAGVALYAYLIINGIIVDSSNVSTTGVYNFLNAPQNAGNTTIVIGTNSLTPGTASAGILNIATNPPTDWVFTGSSAATSSNGTSNSLSVNLGTNTITGLNFGIEKRPDTNPVTQSVAAPTGGSIAAGTITTPVSGADEEDGALGNGKTVKVTDLPGNATMYYLGVAVSPNQILLNFNPANVSYSGIQNGSTSVVFNYAFIDAAGQQDLSPAAFTVNWLTALPINLESFTGTAKDCNSISLNWKVSDAINFNRFVVERSSNGIDFKIIGNVFYKSTIANYSFNETLTDKGSYQYRLKMIDTDEKNKYSPVVLIRLDCNQQKLIIVYPNPVKDKITINGLKGGEEITLYNAQGQIVYNKKNTDYQLNIDLKGVPNGMYHLIITDRNGEKISESKIAKIN